MTPIETGNPAAHVEASTSGGTTDGSGPGASEVLTGFHPAVQRWFGDRFDAPTPPQVRGWEAIRSGRHTLISAPTGSGKTLAAFLDALDGLLREGVETGELSDETRVVYVSPLKALSADIHRNLAEPRKGIRAAARELGVEAPKITAAVRSGDTPRSRRREMVRTPPHILVTTPESLYLYLTARKSRETLRSVRTVIVDEIHAVLESRRGAHLALSLERLADVTEAPLQRIGLSATQNPIGEVARFLVGAAAVEGWSAALERGNADGGRRAADGAGEGGRRAADGAGEADCAIVDEGHEQDHDLALEVPDAPLEAVLPGETREEMYDRVADLIRSHRTTLVFVNTRREAERVAHGLAERLGPEAVTAHHGSLSKERRLDAEVRLREGRLDALVATASMELGIDIGYVDLVCQLGTPNRIATFLQRVGRSGHTVEGTPRGRLFPQTRDEMVQGAALLRAVRRGDLDRVEILEHPLDILSQQIVAEVACGERAEDELFGLVRRAWPYRDLARDAFDEIVEMISRGFEGRNGRKGARIHRDAVNGVLKPRKGSRIAALTCGGAIPDNADYRVLKEPEGTFLGTVNEDFAIESLPGDIFQLGNTSWRLLKVETGAVRVEDAAGEPPSVPFWLGEAPARSDELSRAVSELRREVGERLGPVGTGGDARPGRDGSGGRDGAVDWLASEPGIGRPAARQVVEYLAESKRLLGELPTRDTLVLERFFDESGGMQLVLHAPFGSRVNRAWGLALRKRFCRKFNFELQAAATEEGIILSLGPQHSFPLEDVFRYLAPETVREVLVQAVLDAPMFQTRWRWTATLSLALLRWRGGSKVPPQIQRMEAEDLLTAVFPDALACLENVAGEREVPDHPLVRQTIEDCLTEAMDLPRLVAILEDLRDGSFRTVTRETPEPSPLSHELVSARPYAFLDDAEAEERRTLAVRTRRALEPSAARELGALDPEAIVRVREEAWPDPGTADELHDALLTCGLLRDEEVEAGRGGRSWTARAEELAEAGRAGRVTVSGEALWVAAERLPEVRAAWPDAPVEPELVPPQAAASEPEGPEAAVRELVRGRLEIAGPTTAARVAERLGLEESRVEAALLALETEGAVIRGHFTPAGDETEWCHRGLLARIHRLTLDRLRAEIRPVTARNFLRFLFRWQGVEAGHRSAGDEGLAAVLEQLEGFELPAAAWETEVLAARMEDYDPESLDRLCSAGRIAWGRLTPPTGDGSGLRDGGPLRTSPIALWRRPNTAAWLSARPDAGDVELTAQARRVLEVLEERGASFFPDLVEASGLLPTRLERALGELVAVGLATADSFSGLRALLLPSDRRRALGGARARGRGRQAPYGVDGAGRWSALRARGPARSDGTRDDGTRDDGRPADRDERAEFHARVLLRRYGVVFRRLLEREPHAPPWRELLRVYWRLEARGEVRGGRFVSGFSGQQFALPEAVGTLRTVRKEEAGGELRVVSAADPLNLVGILTPGDRIPARPSNRVAFRDGVPVYARVGAETVSLDGGDPVPDDARRALVLRDVPPVLRPYVTTT